MGVGDRLHDREAEADPVGGRRLRDEVSRWNGWNRRWISPAGITGPVFAIVKMARPAAVYVSDVEPAAREVVADGVRDQVRDEALDQLRVAGCSGRLERRRRS